jgi:predicted double-glycine peptidase
MKFTWTLGLILVAHTVGFRAYGSNCHDALTWPLPLKQETEFTCGPAALASVLRARGLQASENDLAIKLKTNCLEGTSSRLMIAELRQRGFSAELRRNIEIAEFQPFLAGKYFPLLMIQSEGEDHWVALVAVDKDHVTLMDPWSPGPYVQVETSAFELIWFGREGFRAGML